MFFSYYNYLHIWVILKIENRNGIGITVFAPFFYKICTFIHKHKLYNIQASIPFTTSNVCDYMSTELD